MKNKLKELNTELQKSKVRYANLRTTVLCTVDELNQYLNGNVSDCSVIEVLEILKKEIKNK